MMVVLAFVLSKMFLFHSVCNCFSRPPTCSISFLLVVVVVVVVGVPLVLEPAVEWGFSRYKDTNAERDVVARQQGQVVSFFNHSSMCARQKICPHRVVVALVAGSKQILHFNDM